MPRAPEDVHGLAGGGAGISASATEAINGPHIWVATALEDVGYRVKTFQGKPPQVQRTLIARGMLADKGVAIDFPIELNLSYDDKAKLMLHVAAARGGRPPAATETVHIEEIIGKPVQITVNSQAKKSGDGFWVNVKGEPAPLLEGTPIPPCLNEALATPPVPFASKPADEVAELRRQAAVSLGAPAGRNGAGPGTPPPHIADAPPPEGVVDQNDYMPGSEIHRDLWQPVGSLMRKLMDTYFGGDLALLGRYAVEHDIDVLRSFVLVREDGSAAFRLAGRTDPDARDLQRELEGLLREWENPKSEAALAGEVGQDQLPF